MHGNEAIDAKRTQGWTAAGLIAVGLIALGCLIYMNWRFGWSLGTTPADRYAMGTLHILADLASAALVAGAGIMFALRTWRWRGYGALALFCACFFTAWSMISVFGYMSTRIAATKSQAAVLEMQKGNIDWLKSQTVSPAVADAYAAAAAECVSGRGPMCLAAEARAEALANQQANMSKELRQQFKEAQATVSVVHDKQAAAIAAALGYSVEEVQLWLQLAGSGFAQTVKFAGLFFGFTLLPQLIGGRRSTVSSSPKGGSGEGGSSDEKVKSSEKSEPSRREISAALPENVTPIREIHPVRSATVGAIPPSLKPSKSIVEILAERPFVSQSALAAMTGKSPATVSRELKWLEGRKKIDRKRKGRGVQVSLRRDGGLHAVV